MLLDSKQFCDATGLVFIFNLYYETYILRACTGNFSENCDLFTSLYKKLVLNIYPLLSLIRVPSNKPFIFMSLKNSK